MDLYKILGVARDATLKEIKDKYYRMAKRLHPDTGHGDEAKFKQVAVAYAILSDEDKRKRYDDGESVDNIEVDNSKSKLIQGFSELLVKAIQKKDVKYDDLVAMMKAEVDAAIVNGEETVSRVDKAIASIKEAQARFSGEVEMVNAILTNTLGGMEKQKAKYKDEIELLKEMHDKIKKMKYRVDKRDKASYASLNAGDFYKIIGGT